MAGRSSIRLAGDDSRRKLTDGRRRRTPFASEHHPTSSTPSLRRLKESGPPVRSGHLRTTSWRFAEMTELPIIVLAFANEQEGRRYLRDLPEELRRLQDILKEAERNGLCRLESAARTPLSTRSSTSSPATATGSRSSTTPAMPTATGSCWSRAPGAAPLRTPPGWRRSSASGGACNWSSSTAARRAPRSPGCSTPGSRR